jgi:hypothetical protein
MNKVRLQAAMCAPCFCAGVPPALAANRIAFMMTLLDPAAAAQELCEQQQRQVGLEHIDGPLHQHMHSRGAGSSAEEGSRFVQNESGAAARQQQPQDSLI